MKKADKQIRICFWCFVFFLLTEGIFRRWVLPGMSSMFLVAKDPFVAYAVILGLNRGYVRQVSGQLMLLLSLLSFFMTMTLGHGSLFVAAFGVRILWYFPFMYVCAKVLNRDDVLLLGKILVLMLIPVVLVAMIQFLSPGSTLMRPVGGGEVSADDPAFSRPPSIFTFSPAATDFYGVTYGFLLYFLLNDRDAERMKLKRWFLFTCLVFYFLSIPVSTSRTHFFQTLLISCALLYFFRNNVKVTGKIIRIAVLMIIIAPILLSLTSVQSFMEAFTNRFETANEVEGGAANTVYKRVFFHNVVILAYAPLIGAGSGSFTNVGRTYLYGGAKGGDTDLSTISSIAGNTESEWGRVLAEDGLLIGFFILLLRVIIALSLVLKAFNHANRTRDFLPWLLAPLAGEMILFCQLSLGFHVGFTTLGAIAAFTALKRQPRMVYIPPAPPAEVAKTQTQPVAGMA